MHIYVLFTAQQTHEATINGPSQSTCQQPTFTLGAKQFSLLSYFPAAAAINCVSTISLLASLLPKLKLHNFFYMLTTTALLKPHINQNSLGPYISQVIFDHIIIIAPSFHTYY